MKPKISVQQIRKEQAVIVPKSSMFIRKESYENKIEAKYRRKAKSYKKYSIVAMRNFSHHANSYLWSPFQNNNKGKEITSRKLGDLAKWYRFFNKWRDLLQK